MRNQEKKKKDRKEPSENCGTEKYNTNRKWINELKNKLI